MGGKLPLGQRNSEERRRRNYDAPAKRKYGGGADERVLGLHQAEDERDREEYERTLKG